MNRWTVLLATVLVFGLVALGCSGGGHPVAPTSEPDLAVGAQSHGNNAQTHLWGFYDVYIDIETQSVEYVANRNAMFTANVVQFVNKNPANLAFVINSTPMGTGYVDVDIDVTITHPFPGLTDYNGYDVKGIFIGDSSSSLKYNTDLDYAVLMTDQFMQDFDGGGDGLIYGNPDGYTRWWNPTEFPAPGLFGYTPGKVATPGYSGSATLNPYKYFADGLSRADDLWTWLNANAATHAVFSAGAKNTRNYYLRFPTAKGVRYNYAIAADWVDEATHPANAVEAPTIKCDVTPDIYWVPPDGADKGGDLILDVHVWGWGGSQPSTIYVESSVLSAVHPFDSTEMTPVGGDANYSTYHAEITADDITGTAGQEFWVICEYNADYTNTFGVTNLAGTDKLASAFRYDLFVSDIPSNKPPVINSGVDGEDKPIEFTVETYTVDASDPDGDPLTYTWTVTDGNGDPVDGYDGVPGDGNGNLDVDWGEVAGWTQGVTPFDIDCVVDDGADFVPATTLECEVWIEGDWWVSNHADFATVPDNGTQSEPFSSINQAFGYYSYGDIIVVDYGTGTYNEQIFRFYNQGFTLRAWSWYTTPPARPTLTYSGDASIIYLNYTNDVTIRGFKIEIYPGTGSGGYQPIYASYSHNFSLIDCHITGTVSYYYMYALYLYYCDSVTIKNCLFSDLKTSYSYTYAYLYFYIYRGNGTHNVCQNEFTKFQESPQVPGYMYIYMYGYYWPSGSKWCNNLLHHISPNVTSYFSIYLNRIYYPYADVTVANNTVDKIDADHGPDTPSSNVYGMYLYRSSSTMYGHDAHSNIVTNLTGTYTLPYYFGVYTSTYQGTDYMDVWNIQDARYQGYVEGPNSINADPLYVNNTTSPYDYHLDTGSPCIGTGKNGEDMGCYGNLPAGETVVGLLTPE